MTDLCRVDPDLIGYDVSHYEYPTSLHRNPLSSRMSSIVELAAGLRTELATRHSGAEDITIVAHSLGGVVARQYIVEEFRRSAQPAASRLLLYAVPSTGSQLADLGGSLSWNHKQLSDLGLNSALLEQLNEDWERLQVEKSFPVLYAVGGQDRVVSRRSGLPYFGRENVHTLIADDHSSIIAPSHANELSYLLLKAFVLSTVTRPAQIRQSNGSLPASSRAGDPLFDIYHLRDEPFYLERTDDKIIELVLMRSHIWLSGPSGSGKTTGIRRLVLTSRRTLKQISLASYQDQTSIGLLRALHSEIASITSDAIVSNSDLGTGEICLQIKLLLRQLCMGKLLVILIEEIPLHDANTSLEFLELILNLVQILDADEIASGHVLLAFSSITKPQSDIGVHAARLRERLSFVDFPYWQVADLNRLSMLLENALSISLADTERQMAIHASQGSPRFIKMLFRKLHTRQAEGKALSEVIGQVAQECVS